MKPIVVVTDWGFPSLEPEREVLGPLHVEQREYQCKTEDAVVEDVKDADIVMAQWAPVKARAIAAMERCRGIVRYGIGFDNIDLEAATEHDVVVCNITDYCIDEVASHAMALLLAGNRKLVQHNNAARAGEREPLPNSGKLRGETLGLVAFGNIARAVAERAKPFGLNVIAHDPYIDPAIGGYTVSPCTVADDCFTRRGTEADEQHGER